MAEDPHVRKKRGRFIKKGDPISDVLTISDFNLMEICDTSITYADNINSNVIHNKLHEPTEISETVRQSQEIETVFEPAEFRPVIKPLDFTQEWIKQKKQLHSRHSRIDDDDDIDIEMENIARKLRKKFKSSEIDDDLNSPEAEVKKIGESLEFIADMDGDGETHGLDNLSRPQKANEINAFSENTSPLEPVLPTVTATQPPADTMEEKKLPDLSDSGVEFDSNPLIQDQVEADTTPPNVEKDLTQRNIINEHEIENAFQRARSDGFEDGYRDGEEKALLSVQEKVASITEELANVLGELEGLKKNILTSTQENFRMVAEGLVSSLLGRELSINPTSMTSIIEKAVAEAVPNDEFTVLLSQDSYERLKVGASSEFMSKVKVDKELEGNNFKISSDLSVVDGNLAQMVSDMLDQADLNLFEEDLDKGEAS